MSFYKPTAAGSDIPDSAVLHWRVAEGSGSTLSDSIGTNNGSFVGGPSWQSDPTFVGGYNVTLDGVDDYIEASNNTKSIGRNSNHSHAITLSADSSLSDGPVLTNWSDGTNQWGISFRSGKITAGWYDESAGNVIDSAAHPEPTAPYTIRLVATWGGGTDSAELYLNTNTSTTTANPRGTRNQALTVGSHTGGGSYVSGGIDSFVVYESKLSSSEIQQDYDAQPWT